MPQESQPDFSSTSQHMLQVFLLYVLLKLPKVFTSFQLKSLCHSLREAKTLANNLEGGGNCCSSSPEQEIKSTLVETKGTPAFIGEVAYRLSSIFYSVSSNLCVSLGFTLIPGPIVVAMVIRLMYSPFAPDGRAL